MLIRSVPPSLRILDIHRLPESNQRPVEDLTSWCTRLEAVLKHLSPPHDQINTKVQITIRQSAACGVGFSVTDIMQLNKGYSRIQVVYSNNQ